MNIVMMGHKTIPSRDGGIEVVVEELSRRMSLLGNNVTILNRKRKGNKLKEYKGCKIEEVFTINKKSLDAIVYSFFATLRIKRMIRKKQVDIVHVHAEGPCYFLWMFGKKHKNFKLVVTIHGLDWQRGKWGGFATKVLLKGESRAVKYADEIIVLSKNLKYYFDKKYHRATNYIPNGVEKPIFHDPEIIKNNWNLTKNSYVLFLARIVPEKGLHYLIEAWKKVKEEYQTDKKLVIAGGSSHSDEYYNKIVDMCKNDDSIILTGFVEGQLLQELYSNAYLYILPSDIEGMPMSLLEAMSYGNVCLVSDIPENTEIINEEDYTFPAGNIDRLRHQIKKILKLNIQTHENIKLPFNWDEVTNETLEVYKR